MSKISTYFGALVLLFTACSTTQKATSSTSETNQSSSTNDVISEGQPSTEVQHPLLLDELVDHFVRPFIDKDEHIGLSVAMIEGDETRFFHFGEVEKGSGELPNNSHLWEIGSISKTYTAALVVAYCTAKDIPLSTPINDFLPEEFKSLEKESVVMNIAHLLNHTSGLPRLPGNLFDEANEEDPYAHYGREEIMTYISGFELPRTPGEVHEYSNLGFALLGLLIENHSGQTYAELLQEYVLDPLGAKHSFLNLTEEQKALQVHPYLPDGNDGSHWTLNSWAPTGGIQTTIVDLATYARTQLPSYSGTLATIFKGQKTETFRENENLAIGQSWFTITTPTFSWYFHNGGTGGFSSLLLADPATDKALVLFSNNAFQQESEPMGFQLFKAFTEL